ncbi:MAG TPA: FtsX-like permease family protein, partial [Salinimicrobium sp.]|nr:FtsX-like permease family protein [Salinimicrobium sp.]
LIVTLLAGFYPALVLSHFKPVSVLKSQVVPGTHKSSLRKSLTVFQFVIAQVFIIATILVGRQIQFMMTEDMGFKTEAIAYVRTPWHDDSMDKRLRFIEEMKNLTQIKNISLGGAPPASNTVHSTITNYYDGKKEIQTNLHLLYGDTSYLNLYNIDLLAGRNLRNDTLREFVINQTFLKRLGFENPQNAIGKSLEYNDELYPIVGVMEDFNQRSLKLGIEPMAFIGNWNQGRYSQFNTIHLLLKTENPGNWPAVISTAEEVWEDIYPGKNFELKFMDETVQQFYEREQKTAKLLNWATGLSVLISCLGLLGLVIHTTERRTKEIGIRKVLGATMKQLNFLLCREFLLLVGLAFLIAAPIAWWGLHNWLQDFASKTELSWWIFLLSGVLMVILALLIMGAKTWATARKNPVKSLRSE